MADFCRQCSLKIFRENFRELAGLSTAEDTANGIFAQVLCEGCGATLVDHEGNCRYNDCLRKHGQSPIPPEPPPRDLLIDDLLHAMNQPVVDDICRLVKVKKLDEAKAMVVEHASVSPEIAQQFIDWAVRDLEDKLGSKPHETE